MKDYESGKHSTTADESLDESLQENNNYFDTLFNSATKSIQDNSQSMKSYLGFTTVDENDIEQQGLSDSAEGAWNEISRSDRFKYFIGSLLLSFFFFLLSGLFFPAVLVVPQKFVFCYTLGSIFFMSAFAMVQGPSDFFKGLMKADRLNFTVAYFTSVVGTLYTCLFWKTYLGIIFFSWLQILSLGWYAATYLPGGRTGVALISRFLRSFFSNGCVPCFKLVVKMFQKLFS